MALTRTDSATGYANTPRCCTTGSKTENRQPHLNARYGASPESRNAWAECVGCVWWYGDGAGMLGTLC